MVNERCKKEDIQYGFIYVKLQERQTLYIYREKISGYLDGSSLKKGFKRVKLKMHQEI